MYRIASQQLHEKVKKYAIWLVSNNEKHFLRYFFCMLYALRKKLMLVSLLHRYLVLFDMIKKNRLI